MKTVRLTLISALLLYNIFAIRGTVCASAISGKTICHAINDSVKLKVDSNHVYYQSIVKVDSNITEPVIYVRALQFMASENITQTYGYQEEGKLIFATTQDLNINRVYVGDENEVIQPYTVQFSIILDLKNRKYRYTINNVLFFLPTETGNKRETLDEVYEKATNTDSRRIAREAKNLITSFERYITALTNELYEAIEQKSAMNKADF